jgi:hypothetical protein
MASREESESMKNLATCGEEAKKGECGERGKENALHAASLSRREKRSVPRRIN